jgi:selenium-binding protein 1
MSATIRRRDFLTAAAGACLSSSYFALQGTAAEGAGATPVPAACGPTYASPNAAMKADRETLAFVPVIYAGTGSKRPDALATVDLDPASRTYAQIIHRLEMPTIGDELHHFGWSVCSSCHGRPGKHRRFLVVPGLATGNLHVVDAADPRRPKLHKLIRGEEVARKANLSTPHTVHCGPDGNMIVSMLGDAKGNAPGGFLLLDKDFEIAGRWEKSTEGMHANYDFWYQPRHNVMVSSEWAAPNVVRGGFKPDDVKAGRYGRRLHFWDWKQRRIAQSIDLGDEGLIPLEVRFHHDPASAHGFVGAALSSAVWHFHKTPGGWKAEKVIQVEPADPAGAKGWDTPVPGLVTDFLLSLDDRFLYLSNWLHGDVRQYDVSDPSKPRLIGQVWLGGVLGKAKAVKGGAPAAGPQMLQLSLDGRRLYVTDSLYSVWDDQFYPDLAGRGSVMSQLDCDSDKGGLTLNEDFLVDFGKEPGGPARAHEVRFPGGDSTSDIWV